MKKKISRTMLLGLCFSLSLITGVFAQRQTGSLAGKVVDNTGQALPACPLTLESPALLGTRNFISTENGNFRFPALPPGTYTLRAEMPGFKKLSLEGIVISVGKASTITMTLEQAAIEEEVTVTSEAPAVDIKGTKVSVTYSKQLLANIPIRRDLQDVMFSAPGVILSDWEGLRRQFTTHGSSLADNVYALDGLNMVCPAIGSVLANISFDLYEEVELETGAHSAELGSVSGGYINIVTRSGGNEFHGDINAQYFTGSFVDKNFTEEQLDSLEVSSPSMDKSSKDFSFNIGGPILKDKLWFFVSGRFLDWTRLVTDFPKDVEHDEYFGFGKLTSQVTKNVKFMVLFNYTDIYEPYYTRWVSPTTIPEAGQILDHQTSNTINSQLSWIISQNAFLDFRGMYVRSVQPCVNHPGATHYSYDKGTGMYTGIVRQNEHTVRSRIQIHSSMTFFMDNFLGGNHELKFGGEFQKGFNDMDFYKEEGMLLQTYTWNGSPYYYGGNSGRFQLGSYEYERGQAPSSHRQTIYSLYVQDRWTIKDRLTLNLGLRLESSHNYLPEQGYVERSEWMWLDPDYFKAMSYGEVDDLMAFNTFSPRVGFVFDVFGNGKTALKASFSRYDQYVIAQTYAVWRPMGSVTYLWTDNNWNGEIDPADSFKKISQFGKDDYPGDDVEYAKELYAGLSMPYTLEYVIGIDHELLPGFRLGVSYIYKHKPRFIENIEENKDENWSIPYTVADPGYDGVFGTGDDAQLTIWDRAKPFTRTIMSNPEEAYMKYQALEIILEKRMSNKWQIFGSVVYSKTYGTIGPGSYTGSGSGFNTPNYMINRDGRQSFDRPLVIKMQGTYQLPYGLNLSAYFLHSSGEAFTRTLSVFAPNYGSYVTVNAELQGTRRNPSWNRLDLRLEKEFAIGDFGKLGMYIDIFNALNSTYVNVRSSAHGYIEKDGRFTQNPLWHTVSSVSSPRYFMLGLRFRF